MFGSMKSGASAYAQVGIETGVLAASPHKLTVMLYDGALASITTAIREMTAKNIAAKGKAITKAVAIVDEGLRAALNKEQGGELAIQLDLLYEYIVRKMLEANGTNRVEGLQEAHKLLADLRDAWLQIDPQKAASAAPAPAAAPSPQSSQKPVVEA